MIGYIEKASGGTGQEGFWFGLHYIRLVRNFTTEAGTVEDIGFVATDLAKALERGDGGQLTRALDKDQKGLHLVQTPGGLQSLAVISESGFYDVVVRSDKPQGKALRSLVTREILPQLRKTGAYSTAAIQPAQPGSELESKARIVMMLSERLATIPGIKSGILGAATAAAIRDNCGVDVSEFRLALPAAAEPICSCNATKIGELLGITAKQANQALAADGLQFRNARGNWQLTEKGTAWAEAMPYPGKNGHYGYQILWNPEVVKAIHL
jgi:hypothetical protein